MQTKPHKYCLPYLQAGIIPHVAAESEKYSILKRAILVWSFIQGF